MTQPRRAVPYGEIAVFVFCLLMLTLQAGQATTQSDPTPVDPPCDARLLDVQEELVNTQELLAEWQARAIRAEARLARAAIADRRRALTPAAPAAKDDSR